jgi:peptidase M28-like protein
MKKLCLWIFLAFFALGCRQAQLSASAEDTPSVTPEIASTPGVVALSVSPTLKNTVETLSEKIGERNLANYGKLEQTRSYITRRLERAGYQVELDEFKVEDKSVYNLVASKAGDAEILVVGAHYDTAFLTPGANDNGSGVAVLLELAERLKDVPLERTVRFVFFVNEEPPYFFTDSMGSEVYASRCAEAKDQIIGMLSLETMGYYSEEPGSQNFPPGIEGYPDTGNFLAFVSEPNSRKFLKQCLASFQGLPVESLVAPATTEGVSWSDHASFWKHGYAGVMVTDTAPFRYPHYHRKSDTADKLDYQSLGRAVDGLEMVIRAVAIERPGSTP